MSDHLPALIDALEIALVATGGIETQRFVLLRNSAHAGMLKIFRDGLHRPIGYVAWAEVTKETCRTFIKKGARPAYQHEWKEGKICLILDVGFTKSGAREAAMQLRKFVLCQPLVVGKREGKRNLHVYRKGIAIQKRRMTTP